MAAEKFQKLVDDYTQLLSLKHKGSLGADDSALMRRLSDVLLEAGVALDAEGWPASRRGARSALSLDVSFESSAAAAHSFTTRDFGTGGFAISTGKPLRKGTLVSLQVKVPGWSSPLATSGEVAWASDKAMGIAFRDLTPEDGIRIKSLISEHDSFLLRLRAAITRHGGDAQVANAPLILLRVADAVVGEASVAVLELLGNNVVDEVPPGFSPSAIVADLDHVLAAVEGHPTAPLVLVNVSGADALAGKMSRLQPTAFIKRPATAGLVIEAIRKLQRESRND